MRASRFVPAVSALSVALSLALYLPTFGNAFAYDDIDYVNLAGRVLSGQLGLWKTLFYPHSEHLVAVFQALFFAYLRLIGIDALPWRVFIAIVHSLSAILLAIVARRYAGTARAGMATAIVYTGACGFSSMWIWFPTGATVPLLMAMLTGAAALLAWRDHLMVRRLIAGALVVLALFTESAFAPMALLPAVIDEYERRREGRRGVGLFTGWTVAVILAVAALVVKLRNNLSAPLSIDVRSGVPRAMFLVLSAPFRFFVPGTPIVTSSDTHYAMLGCVFGITIASAVAIVLVGLWRGGVPPLAVVAGLTLTGSLGVIALIGLGRWHASYASLFDTDRYYFPLLVPVALLAGAVASSISFEGWPRPARLLLLLFLSAAVLGELALQRRAMLASIPNLIYSRHRARLRSLTRLAETLDRAGPIEIPRQLLWFPDLHNGRLSSDVLTEILCRGCTHLHLGTKPLDAAATARLNVLLEQWARDAGEPLPFLRVVNGRIVNERVQWRVDFAEGDCASRVSGFHEWRKPYRWMTQRGEVALNVSYEKLTITMAAPISELRHRFGWSSLAVRASLLDTDSGLTVPLGTATIDQDGVRSYTFPTTPFDSIFGSGRDARLILVCNHTWTPVAPDVSGDPLPRSVQLFAAGTAGPDLW